MILSVLLAASIATTPTPDESIAIKKNYLEHCAQCHGVTRFGGMGPALLPENLSRLKKSDALKTIRNGRTATQMPGFSKKLDDKSIENLTDWIYSAPAKKPTWTIVEIVGSHQVIPKKAAPGSGLDIKDPLNLFIVVEGGDHHISLLDGDKLEVVHRFPTRYALHGGAKFSPDGRYTYIASRDGWVTKYDLHQLQNVAEIRVGINTRNIAVSVDGRYVLAGNYLPETMVLLDARDLSLVQVIDAIDKNGNSSRVSAVYQVPTRNSFVAALKDLPEILEIPISGTPADKGHAFYGHGPFTEEMRRAVKSIEIRHVPLETTLDDFFFDPAYKIIFGADRKGGGGRVIDFETGKELARVPISGMPHLGSGITWNRGKQQVMATPNLKEGLLTVIDQNNWQIIKQIQTLGPGFFLRSHEKTPYVWADVFFGPNKDVLHVIDKQTLEIIKTVKPAPGITAAHVEFDRYGKYALVSIWDPEGFLVIYDAKSLTEIKRLPMRRPIGKYNVHNKINRSSGTSH